MKRVPGKTIGKTSAKRPHALIDMRPKSHQLFNLSVNSKMQFDCVLKNNKALNLFSCFQISIVEDINSNQESRTKSQEPRK
jgi:hypothetical protein